MGEFFIMFHEQWTLGNREDNQEKNVECYSEEIQETVINLKEAT
jgi:hypothetical protein